MSRWHTFLSGLDIGGGHNLMALILIVVALVSAFFADTEFETQVVLIVLTAGVAAWRSGVGAPGEEPKPKDPPPIA